MVLRLLLLFLILSNISFASIVVGKWNEPITPTTADYVERLVNTAEKRSADLIILQLDTPGGLETSMRDIIKTMQQTTIPFVVYVAPNGARAASAGAIITISADIAVMAPSTNIGSASPVSMEGKDIEQTMKKKVVNDMVAFVKAIAKEKGRNEELIAKMVTESINLTSEEALKNNVIDFIAKDISDLLNKVQGREVIKNGKTLKLSLQDKNIVYIETNLKEKILTILSNPTVAYFLLMIGFYGLFFELYNPGSIIPGTLGAISLALALYSLSIISANWLGVILIGLGVLFFILEIITPLFGGLAVAGVISLLLGSIILFPSDSPYGDISIQIIVATVIVSSIFFLVVAYFGGKIQREKPKTGLEAMIGDKAESITDINKKGGKVLYHGEIWNAFSDELIPKGEDVIIEDVEGLKLKVKKA